MTWQDVAIVTLRVDGRRVLPSDSYWVRLRLHLHAIRLDLDDMGLRSPWNRDPLTTQPMVENEMVHAIEVNNWNVGSASQGNTSVLAHSIFGVS